jgi:peptidoglycan-associated lipoprotein
MSSMIRLPLLLIPALLLAIGCTSTSSAPDPSEAVEPTPVADTQSSDSQVATVSVALEPIYFDTDRAVLRAEARDVLDRSAKSILDHPEWGMVEIEGHCDERGSDQHNLALGKRRAAAVKRHLVDMGVPLSRIATHTFGSDRPAARGHDEGAWRRNRRAELRVEDSLASN